MLVQYFHLVVVFPNDELAVDAPGGDGAGELAVGEGGHRLGVLAVGLDFVVDQVEVEQTAAPDAAHHQELGLKADYWKLAEDAALVEAERVLEFVEVYFELAVYQRSRGLFIMVKAENPSMAVPPNYYVLIGYFAVRKMDNSFI